MAEIRFTVGTDTDKAITDLEKYFDAVNKGSVAIEKVDKSKLPKVLQDTTTEELKKIISKQSRKRKEIQAKIKELDKKRRKFVNEKQKSGAKKDELNSVLIQAIKRQAKLKNYSW